MDTTFSSTIASWQNFYILAGTASATLIGLIFVAVSLHIDLIGESGAATILSLARRTFTRFIMVVVVALLFLVPRQDELGLGLPLLALGVVDAVRTFRVGRHSLTALKRTLDVEEAMSRIVFPVALPSISSVGLLFVAATVLTGTTSYLYLMVPIIAAILTNAASNAWDLMLGLAVYKVRRAGGESVRDTEPSVERGAEERLEHAT